MFKRKFRPFRFGFDARQIILKMCGLQLQSKGLHMFCDPERAEAHYQIGVTLEKSVRQAEAIREYETAVEMAPCQVDARTALGRATLKLGQWATAAAQFRAVIALQPKNAEAKKAYDQASESAASERKP